MKAVLTPVLRLSYRVRVEGKEHLPKKGPVILAANHRSFLDSIFLPLVLRRRVTFVAKAEYFDSKKTAWFFRGVGQIPIRREGGSASERALASATEVLEAGGVFGIYPEGTRTRDGYLHRGHTGRGSPRPAHGRAHRARRDGRHRRVPADGQEASAHLSNGAAFASARRSPPTGTQTTPKGSRSVSSPTRSCSRSCSSASDTSTATRMRRSVPRMSRRSGHKCRSSPARQPEPTPASLVDSAGSVSSGVWTAEPHKRLLFRSTPQAASPASQPLLRVPSLGLARGPGTTPDVAARGPRSASPV